MLPSNSKMISKMIGRLAKVDCRNYSKVGILGVPFCKGQKQLGCDLAPQVIRDAGLIDNLKLIHDDIDIKDYGDVSYKVDDNSRCVANMTHYEHTPPCMKELSKRVAKVINDGRLCMSIGGDHAMAIGTIDGHLSAKPDNVSILWVDAHCDINTSLTSMSGNIQGMPLSFLCSEMQPFSPRLPGMEWQQGRFDAKHLAYIGLRSVDPYERTIIDKFSIAAYCMEEIQEYGINAVLEKAMQRIDPEARRSIHISFDIDSLDYHEAPSTVLPIRGGLTLREGIHIVEKVSRTGRLGAIDLVEVNPTIGSERDVQITVNSAINVLMAACKHRRGGLATPSTAQLPIPPQPRYVN